MSVTASQQCKHCGTVLCLPEWSESVGANETVHFWRCMVCGHGFETKEGVAEAQPSELDLAEEFLPNLVVE